MIKDVPILISASAISAYQHIFSISAYRLSANILVPILAIFGYRQFVTYRRNIAQKLSELWNKGGNKRPISTFSHLSNEQCSIVREGGREKHDFTPSRAKWAQFTQIMCSQGSQRCENMFVTSTYLIIEQFSGKVTCESESRKKIKVMCLLWCQNQTPP